MTALVGRRALNAMLTTRFGPFLREHGFRGSRPTWRLSNAQGDVAIANAQASQWGTVESARFCVNLGLVPEPLWAWELASGQALGRLPDVNAGLQLGRLAKQPASPTTSEIWWEVDDAISAHSCGDELMKQAENWGLPTLRRLLRRDSLLDAVREKPTTPQVLSPTCVYLLTKDLAQSFEQSTMSLISG